MSPTLSPNLILTPEIERLIDERVAARVAQLEERIAALTNELEAVRGQLPADRVTIVLTSNNMDRAMSAFIIATGAASLGMEATVFCTFWGVSVLRDKTLSVGKSFLEKAMSRLLPSSAENLSLSKMNFWGAGAAMMRYMMKKHNVESVPNLIDIAIELGVRIVACQMTMGIMGITTEELRPGVEYGGVASYIEEASSSKITLFI